MNVDFIVGSILIALAILWLLIACVLEGRKN